MAALFLVDDSDLIVFTFSPTNQGTWYFSRVSPLHLANGKDKFVIRQEPDGRPTRWVLENISGGKADVFGTPKDPGNGPPYKDLPSPPLGKWKVWGYQFTLTSERPRYKPVDSPCHFEVPFASLRYHEKDRVAYIELAMKAEPIRDDDLESMLEEMRRLLKNVARRPEMVLMMRSDARQTPERPAVAHIRRFLAFVREDVGTECVLAGRGSAIVLVPTGFLGRALLGIVQFVQRILPAPYPQAVVSTTEEADAFLEELANESRTWLATLPGPKNSLGRKQDYENEQATPTSSAPVGSDTWLSSLEQIADVEKKEPASSSSTMPTPQLPAASSFSEPAEVQIDASPRQEDVLEGANSSSDGRSRVWCAC